MEKRKRTHGPGVDLEELPHAKRAAVHLDERQRERLRGEVRALHEQYEALYSAPPDGAQQASFQALLDAAQGSCASRRLAARLIPRFVSKFPASADTAAALLIDLHDGRHPPAAPAAPAGRRRSSSGPAPPPPGADPLSAPVLEEAARRDALAGLAAVLQVAAGLEPALADAAVARILGHATRLLGELSDGGGGEAALEGEAEEGEVDDRVALAGLARAAFQHHTRRVLAFCVGCLARPEPHPDARDAAARGARDARRGARIVLSRVALRPPPRALRERLGRSGSDSGDCWLALVLRGDEALQQWVVQAGTAPGVNWETRQVLDQLQQLLPPPPLPSEPPPPSPKSKLFPGTAGTPQQQHQQQQQQQQQPSPAVNGGGMARNGIVPLQRASSGGLTPGAAPPQRREPRAGFSLAPAGAVSRVEPVLLVWGLPGHVTAAALAAEAGAREAWLLEGPCGDEACLTFETVQEAARCYQRLTGESPFGPATAHQQQQWQRLPPQQQQRGGPPGRLKLEFCAALPRASALASPPSPYTWVAASTGADAPRVVELLVAAGAGGAVKNVLRVGGASPGMLLQAEGAGVAAQVADALARRLLPPGARQPQGGAGAGAGPGTPAAHQQQQQLQQQGSGNVGQHWQQQQQQAAGVGQSQQWGTPQQPRLGGGGGGPHDTPSSLPPPRLGGGGGSPSLGGGTPSAGAGSGAGSCVLSVAGIPRDASEPEFLGAFGGWGRLVDHRFVRGGDGWVAYADAAAAQRALEGMQGRRLGSGAGPPLRLDYARRPPGGPGPARGVGAGVGAPSPGGPGRPPPGWDRGGEQQQQQQQRPGGDWEGRGERGGAAPPLLPQDAWGGPVLGGGERGPGPPPAGRPPQPPLPPSQQPSPGFGAKPAAAAPPPGWPPQPVLWRGRLSKSKAVQCELLCVDAGVAAGGARAEPFEWPGELAVLNRSRVREVLDAFRAAPHGLRAVRRLLPSGGPGSVDDAGLAGFSDYLRSKDRAGLARLPPSRGVGHPRDVHLIVPEDPALRELGLPPPRPGERSLVAIVTPGRDDGSGGAPTRPPLPPA
ncbi:MAG: hypothetical protein J3K34DRAFT_522541 [Monoraphidium minutum]|nr:MAG: hypothetical protein J3K34DRAFT_522541 [Monoraphidium minutum]